MDWDSVYRLLLHGKPRVPIGQIESLTMPEVALLLDQDLEQRRAPTGSRPTQRKGDPGEIQDLHKRLRAMTALERVRFSREAWLDS